MEQLLAQLNEAAPAVPMVPHYFVAGNTPIAVQ